MHRNLGQTTTIIMHKLMVNEGLIGVLLAAGNQTQTNLFIGSIQIRLWDAEAAGRHTRYESDENAPNKCSVDSFCPQVCCCIGQTSSLAQNLLSVLVAEIVSLFWHAVQ
jgi:hypothetical protein